MRLVVLLLFAVAACGVCYGKDVAAVWEDGYDVIYLDYPGFIHEFHYDWVTNKFYAYGEGDFRQIDHDASHFAAVDNATLAPYNHPFIDVRLFSPAGKSDLWAIGPAYRSQRSALNVGYFLPLNVVGPGSNNANSEQGGKHGYTFYAVSVDSRNFSHVLVYFVGWGEGRYTQITGSKPDSVNFLVVRAHIDLTQTPFNRRFDWVEGAGSPDILSFYEDDFHPFHSTNRPRIVHDFTNDKLFVIEPNTLKIYAANVPRDGVSAITSAGNAVDLSGRGLLVSSTWHYYNDILYLGFAGIGISNGSLIAVDLKALQITRSHEFSAYLSNPRAIAGQNSSIFIGFEGGPTILKFDVNAWQVAGHQRLPDYLREVYTAWDTGYNHIYFATYEQHSKIFRIHKDDFCARECPEDGHCETQRCLCNEGYALSEDKAHCVIPPKIVPEKTTDTAAATALGVLFGFSFVAAVVGWVLFYRKTSEGSYQRIINNT